MMPLLSFAVIAVTAQANICSVGDCKRAKYNYTIDCSSFNRPQGWKAPSTCALEGDWSKIIDRKLPEWYADMKLGIFIHWGVYSVPSYGSEWFWHSVECQNGNVAKFKDRVYGKDWPYPQFASLFNAELYDAKAWAKTIKSSGAQYVLPVAKHHDGFCMWNTSTSPGWNAVDVGPKRDVLAELYEATQAEGIDWGIYFSQGEWFDADMVADARSNFTKTAFIKKMAAQRVELVEKFPNAILWHTDGGWFAPDAYWRNLEWLTWIYEESPLKDKVVTCNSLGFNCCQKYPGSDTCWEYGDAPSGGDRTTAGKVVPHYYTNQMTIQKGSWSWDRSEPLSSMLTTGDLLQELIQTTAWNGTLVMNIGPTADGRIPPIFEERLGEVGAWLGINGEAIYSSRPWSASLPSGGEHTQNTTVYYTWKRPSDVYCLIVGRWPLENRLLLTIPRPSLNLTMTRAVLLATNTSLEWQPLLLSESGMNITIGAQPPETQWAWVVRLTGLVNSDQ